MGRVSRHKKIKAIDPFSKTHGVARLPAGKTPAAMDLAPKRTDEDSTLSRRRTVPGLGGAGPVKKYKPARATKRPRDEDVAEGDDSRPAASDKKPKMPQLERQPGESLRQFRTRLRETAKLAMLHNREKAGGFRTVSEARRAYLERRSDGKRLKLEGKLLDAIEERPEAAGSILQRAHGAVSLPKDLEIERRVMERAKVEFHERADAPPQLELSARLAHRVAAKRTQTIAEKMLQQASKTNPELARSAWKGHKERSGPRNAEEARLDLARKEAMAQYSTIRQRRLEQTKKHAVSAAAWVAEPRKASEFD
jgi:hypothetical protein